LLFCWCCCVWFWLFFLVLQTNTKPTTQPPTKQNNPPPQPTPPPPWLCLVGCFLQSIPKLKATLTHVRKKKRKGGSNSVSRWYSLKEKDGEGGPGQLFLQKRGAAHPFSQGVQGGFCLAKIAAKWRGKTMLLTSETGRRRPSRWMGQKGKDERSQKSMTSSPRSVGGQREEGAT